MSSPARSPSKKPSSTRRSTPTRCASRAASSTWLVTTRVPTSSSWKCAGTERVPDDRSLRTTFNQVAEQYHGVRPPLPPEVFDELVALTHIPRGGRVLEVGAGTGRATTTLARLSYQVVAVELGDALAAVARRNLAPFAHAEGVTAPVEEWPLPPQAFDVVTAVDAWPR